MLWSQKGLSISIILQHHSEDKSVKSEILLMDDLASVSFEGSEVEGIKEP